MNYRHAYHAGNFADVLKHVVLSLVIEHLKLKPSPFRIIDTHAGTGLYDLEAEAAIKTLEWHDGIGRMLDAPLPPSLAPDLDPYLEAVRASNPGGVLRSYPGSPLIARRLMRAGDRLVVNELHAEDHQRLADLFARDKQVKVLNLDGWTALKSLLPPPERRGAILVDPPFEQLGEMERLAEGVGEALRRFATGTLLLWYPVKDPSVGRALWSRAASAGVQRSLRCELYVRHLRADSPLAGCGLLIVNPPYTLARKLAAILPCLVERLGVDAGAHSILKEPGSAGRSFE